MLEQRGEFRVGLDQCLDLSDGWRSPGRVRCQRPAQRELRVFAAAVEGEQGGEIESDFFDRRKADGAFGNDDFVFECFAVGRQGVCIGQFDILA